MMIAFGLYEDNIEDLIFVYQEVSCYIIFNANMGEKFCCKSRMVAVEHSTTTQSSLIY